MTDLSESSKYDRLDEDKSVRYHATFMSMIGRRLESYFAIRKRGSTVKTEILAGFINFLANSYLLIVVPQILDRNENGLDKKTSAFAFIVTTCVSSLLVGMLSNLPIPAGPGIAGATYVSYSLFDLTKPIESGDKNRAMTICFISGICMIFLSPVATMIVSISPKSVTSAIPVGLGLVFALNGFMEMGIVVQDDEKGLAMANSFEYKMLLSGIGLVAMAYMHQREIHSGMAVIISAIAIAAWVSHLTDWPEGVVSIPKIVSSPPIDFYSLSTAGNVVSRVVGLCMICAFDIFGISYGVGIAGGLIEVSASSSPSPSSGVKSTSRLRGLSWVFFACSLGSVLASALAMTPVIALGESFAGVLAGGRTGLTAVSFAFFMMLTTPFLPIVRGIPDFATAPVLVMLGVNLMALLKHCDFEDTLRALPSFLVISIMPFTGSLDRAILAGLAAHAVLFILDFVVSRIFKKCKIDVDLTNAENELKVATSKLLNGDDDDDDRLKRVRDAFEGLQRLRNDPHRTRTCMSTLERTSSEVLSRLHEPRAHSNVNESMTDVAISRISSSYHGTTPMRLRAKQSATTALSTSASSDSSRLHKNLNHAPDSGHFSA